MSCFEKKEEEGPSALEILQEAELEKQKIREIELEQATQIWTDQQKNDLIEERRRLKKRAKEWKEQEQKRVDMELWYAAKQGVLSKVASLILEGGAVDGSFRGGDNWSASEVAAHEGFTHIVEWFELGEKSARTLKRHHCKNQAELDEELYQACRDSNFEQVQELLAEGARPDGHKNFWGLTALHKSTTRKRKGGLPTMQLLLDAGANVNQIDGKDGSTPLHKAAERGLSKKVEWLLVHGADINLQDHAGETALHCATDHGHVKTVKLLVNHGADLKIKNRAQRDASNIGVIRKHHKIIEFLDGVPWNIAETKADRRLIFKKAMEEVERSLNERKEKKRQSRLMGQSPSPTIEVTQTKKK